MTMPLYTPISGIVLRNFKKPNLTVPKPFQGLTFTYSSLEYKSTRANPLFEIN
jgi:hypothetical protein